MPGLDFCIVGAGAIGGSLAVRLTVAGVPVSVIARGAHGQAIRDHGLCLDTADGLLHARPPCFARLEDAPPHDVIVVAVKGPDLPALAEALPSRLRPGGRIVFAMNGIPFWFGGPNGEPLPEVLRHALDPGGALARCIDPATIVGAVVRSSNERVAPGEIRAARGGRHSLVLGRPDGTADAVLDVIVAALLAAGYGVQTSPDIRSEIWTKTLLAASAGPVAALTGLDLGALTADPGSFALLAGLMQEGIAIGRAFGLTIDEDVEGRLAFFCGKAVRPSMLQDMEAGRAPEIENGILAFAGIAAALGMNAPRTQALGALIRARSHAAGAAL